mgnify:CR=1 FL=1
MAKKQFLYENVYNDLKHKIECGDLKPGDKLEVEEDNDYALWSERDHGKKKH